MEITDPSDIIVENPLPRQTLRNASWGYHVSCSSRRCEWAGLFPTLPLAEEAVNAHLYRRRRKQDAYHVGRCGADCTQLEADRARRLGDTHHVYIGDAGPAEPLSFDSESWGPWYPRSTDDVDGLVQRGDRIELPGDREGKVARVTETRSCGIATWSVAYADPGTDLTRDDWQSKFQNELVARDGDVYCRYGEEFLGAPVFEVVGEAEHQADFTEFAEGRETV
ncbi:hypothetical protein SG26_20500 (plasmid) [Haloarcula sp. CBA1115]|uniref:hypothetical protein n=1 Tax=Haloarcula sp. CBA1115 TaxID=1592728 RepID=UPI0005955893|nr:hypothetical protein [Haloarcula sp. CBA1115]AJF28131.1 hypothetical protein SG26_20500 [Haloarcula sp. CBA1115]